MKQRKMQRQQQIAPDPPHVPCPPSPGVTHFPLFAQSPAPFWWWRGLDCGQFNKSRILVLQLSKERGSDPFSLTPSPKRISVENFLVFSFLSPARRPTRSPNLCRLFGILYTILRERNLYHHPESGNEQNLSSTIARSHKHTFGDVRDK